MILAIVNNGVVTSTPTITDPSVDGGAAYLAASQGVEAAIDITNTVPAPQVGWVFANGTLSPPAGQMAATIITRFAFRMRFTMEELVGFYAASDDLPAGYPVKVLMDNLAEAEYIDLSDPVTAEGLGLLVESGLLTSDRMTAILTTTPTANELYNGGN